MARLDDAIAWLTQAQSDSRTAAGVRLPRHV